MRTIVLDEAGLASLDDAHELLARELDFPPYYGRNFAALSDCIGDVSDPVTIVVARLPKGKRSSWFSKLANVLARCCAENACTVYRLVESDSSSCKAVGSYAGIG